MAMLCVNEARDQILLATHTLKSRPVPLADALECVLADPGCDAVLAEPVHGVPDHVGKRQRLTGSPAAKPMGGKRPYLLEEQRGWLLARIREKPDLTLHALLGELAAARGVVVSCDTLWRFLKREGISFKKNAARQRAGSA